jgi:hypothetical protein
MSKYPNNEIHVTRAEILLATTCNLYYNRNFNYLCMYVGRATSGPCTATITDLQCFPFYLPLYQSHTPNELQGLTYGGVIIVTWLHKKLAQATKLQISYSLTVTEDMCG